MSNSITRDQSRHLLLFLLCAASVPTHAADLPDPPELPTELLPHCTWDWMKVDMTRFEIRKDGRICAGRQCINEGFYDPWSLEACGFDQDTASMLLRAHVIRPRASAPLVKELRDKLTTIARRKSDAAQAATTNLDACQRGAEEAHLLTLPQASAASKQCDAALAALHAGDLRSVDESTLTQVRDIVRARVVATGGKP